MLAVGLAVLAGFAVYLARGFTFVADEWDILAHHVHGALLTPYNGHLSAIPIAIYQGLAHTAGVGSYTPYLVVGVVGFLAVPVAFHLTHRRVVGSVVSAMGALAIAWSSAASTNLLYGFLVNFNLPLVMLLVAWWLIRRDTPRSDWWAVATVAVALASSSVGVVVAFAVIAELVFARVALRRLVRFAPPVVAWLVWWVARHESTTPATVGERLAYAWHMTVGILAGFTLGWEPGAVVVAAVIAAVVVSARRRGRLDTHVAAIGAAFVFFVVLSSFSRAGEIVLNPPDAPRYVWLGDLLVIAALVWCLRGVRIRPRAVVAVALVVVIGAVGLVDGMRDHRRFVLDADARTRAFLVGAEAAGVAADPDRILPLNMIPVTVGEYLEMVATVGSPVEGLTPDRTGNPDARRDADAILVGDVGLVSRPVGDVDTCPDGDRPRRADSSGPVELAPGDTLLVGADTSAARVSARRLAPAGYGTDLGGVEPGAAVSIVAPTDRSLLPWIVEVDGPDVSVWSCVVGSPDLS